MITTKTAPGITSILLVTFAISSFAVESPFVSSDPVGSVLVTLHPSPEVVGQGPIEFSFGIPWPKNTLRRTKFLKVTENGEEIPSSVAETLRWRPFDTSVAVLSIEASRARLNSALNSLRLGNLGRDSVSESVRGTRITIQRAFDSEEPVEIAVHWGRARLQDLVSGATDRNGWLLARNGQDPDEYPSDEQILEPPVYATLPAAWLGNALVRGRTTPVGTRSGFFDDALIGFAKSAVNDVPESVLDSELVDYITRPSPWLYDRASTLYSAYLRTGDVKWLRHAHRATEFYSNHIIDGSFDLQPTDIKYAYGRPFLFQALLMGDTGNFPKAVEVAIANRAWPSEYSPNLGFWTERHTAYAVLSEINLWQIDGNNDSATRIDGFITNLLDHQDAPPSNWRADGCFLHTVAQHEGNSVQEPACSPWMSALLGEAIWEYYIVSEDVRALQLLSGLADYVADAGTRIETSFSSALRPWFLASSTFQQGNADTDMEHTCDVAGLTARGLWAKAFLGMPMSVTQSVLEDLTVACEQNLEYWYRPPAGTRPAWRLSPPQKFNWWFGTTTDLPWFLTQFSIG